MLANLFIIQGVPSFAGWQFTTLRPPMSSILAHNRKQSLPNFVQYENTRLLNGVILIATMKDQDFRKGSQQMLLHTSGFRTLLAFPGGILLGNHRSRDGIGNALGFVWRQWKLQHTFANQVGVITLQTGNPGTKLKPQQLVQPWNLITQRHQKFVAVSNVFSSGQIFGTHRLVKFRQTIALRVEDLLQSQVSRGILGIELALPLLQLRNPKESLKSRIDPTGSFHVSQAEHLTLTKRTC